MALAITRIAEGMTGEQLRIFSELTERRSYADGETILGDADNTHELLILLSGRAEVVNLFNQEIGIVEPGSLIGELSFLDGKARSAKVVSKGATECAALTRPVLQTLHANHPEIVALVMQNIALALAEKLRGATRLVTALSAGF